MPCSSNHWRRKQSAPSNSDPSPIDAITSGDLATSCLSSQVAPDAPGCALRGLELSYAFKMIRTNGPVAAI